jgi:hypothetical protein
VPGFEERALCRAPATEVWKLLHDPSRYPEWWLGTQRVEDATAEGVTRYDERWPDFPYPTQVASDPGGSRVVISCLVGEIRFDWRLHPAPEGCAVHLTAVLPEAEAPRLEEHRAAFRTSLGRLVSRAEELA